MTRTGKIARLPREVRDQLNRRLSDGEQQSRLVDWLNSLPEVQAVLKADFDERPVSEQNLSEWKQGGYRDWVLQQEALDFVRHMDADADELNQASKVRLTDLLTQRLAARYVIAAQALGRPNEDGEIDLKLLRELCGDIVALRKGDHSAERLRLERERLDFERDQLRELREEEFREWAREHRDEVCEGYMIPEERNERINRVRRRVFGKLPEDHGDGGSRQGTGTARMTPGPLRGLNLTKSDPIKPDQTSYAPTGAPQSQIKALPLRVAR